MVKELENLREDEVKVLMDAPIYVAILIAGADGEIDKSERKEAVEVARSKQSRARDQLVEYYKEVGVSFEEKFNQYVKDLPADTEERNKVITTELRKLNFILPKIDKNFGIKLYASLKELAKKIAESSGGILGYLSIGHEERRLLDLKMIQNPEK